MAELTPMDHGTPTKKRSRLTGLGWTTVIGGGVAAISLVAAGLVAGYHYLVKPAIETTKKVWEEGETRVRAEAPADSGENLDNVVDGSLPLPRSEDVNYGYQVRNAYNNGLGNMNASPREKMEHSLRGVDAIRKSGYNITDPKAVPVHGDLFLYTAQQFEKDRWQTATTNYLEALSFWDDKREEAMTGLDGLRQKYDIRDIVKTYHRKKETISTALTSLADRYVGSILEHVNSKTASPEEAEGTGPDGYGGRTQIDRATDKVFEKVRRNLWEISDNEIREVVDNYLSTHSPDKRRKKIFLQTLDSEYRRASGFRKRVIGAARDHYRAPKANGFQRPVDEVMKGPQAYGFNPGMSHRTGNRNSSNNFRTSS